MYQTIFWLFLLGQMRPAIRGQNVWSGVYSSSQASRGEKVYGLNCRSCHKETLTGINSVLKGEPFMTNWREDNLWTLFSLMKSTMPRVTPGSLSDDQYLDIISYVLQQNGFPAGADDLKITKLRTIWIQTETGPKPLPDRTPVVTAGCLREIGASWRLSKAFDLARVHNRTGSLTESEFAQFPKITGGTRTFSIRLPSLRGRSLRVELKTGRPALIKAYLITNGSVQYLELSDSRPLAGSCD